MGQLWEVSDAQVTPDNAFYEAVKTNSYAVICLQPSRSLPSPAVLATAIASTRSATCNLLKTFEA